MKYLAKIHVTLKKSVLDPQGVAVTDGLHSMGYREVEDLRLGKYMELKVDDNGKNKTWVSKRVDEMCKKLLSNGVIETYAVTLEKAGK